jgi:hypothetical protein
VILSVGVSAFAQETPLDDWAQRMADALRQRKQKSAGVFAFVGPDDTAKVAEKSGTNARPRRAGGPVCGKGADRRMTVIPHPSPRERQRGGFTARGLWGLRQPGTGSGRGRCRCGELL